jgi:hypothetical protein
MITRCEGVGGTIIGRGNLPKCHCVQCAFSRWCGEYPRTHVSLTPIFSSNFRCARPSPLATSVTVTPIAPASDAEAYLGYGRQGTCHGCLWQGGGHLAWHNLIDLVRLGINIFRIDILFY